jgi:hypothetical protein
LIRRHETDLFFVPLEYLSPFRGNDRRQLAIFLEMPIGTNVALASGRAVLTAMLPTRPLGGYFSGRNDKFSRVARHPRNHLTHLTHPTRHQLS